MKTRFGLSRVLALATVVALISPAGWSGGAVADDRGTNRENEAPASVTPGVDRLLPPRVTPIGTFEGVRYVRYSGVFEGQTSTGAFRVPYQITAAQDPRHGNRTVLVEPSHFAIGLGVRDIYLRPRFLFGRGFAHAGIGWSTATFGPGRDKRILDPTVPDVFIAGGVAEGGGRTDNEIIVAFARALAVDWQAKKMLGKVARRYASGFSDASTPLMDLIISGRASKVFDFALPFLTEEPDPQPALRSGRFRGKLIVLNSEADASSALIDRRLVPDRYRFYQVAGTPHVADPPDIPFFSNRTTPASYEPALRAHFLQGDRWVRRGSQPPASYHLRTTGGTGIARDTNGHAIAVDVHGRRVPRLPFVELGEARYTRGFLGSYDRVRSIAELGFGSHARYREAFRRRLSDHAEAGYILPRDAEEMRARAALCPPLTFTQTYRGHYDNFVAIDPC
ncbi:hypothetical protein GCM10010404_72030 [Nonomuraea africana]|uniref:Alpha/beta hydrolase domain-containing protein n=1 Tax=Nonomuraea africana TaxID=46171 RepID=A0ABR9K871_9ACTN|nr:alpha/beta hydrolase domain-containing protein [Nonomuraea africana]MBE1557996.1 hypothetical protein [Nonomuraea africana]